MAVAMGDIHLVGTDVLSDAAGLSRRHPRLADRVEQAGLAVVDVTHHRDHRRPADQVGQVAVLDHLHGLLGRGFHVVLEHRHAELLGHRFDRLEVEGLGDRGDDPLEEKGLDDLGALHPEPVGQLLHREVAFRHDQHFGPLGLGLAGGAQLHGPAPLALAGGLLLALADRHGGFGRGPVDAAGPGGTGQARLQHQGFLFAGVATCLGGEGIIVLADDVDLLALLLRGAAAKGFELGAVVPVGPAGPRGPNAGRRGLTEAGAPGRRRRGGRGTGDFGAAAGFTAALAPVGPTRRRGGGTAGGLLELHQLTGSHRLAHTGRDARAAWRGGASGRRGAGPRRVAADRLADQFKGSGTRTAGGIAGPGAGLPWPDRRGGAWALGSRRGGGRPAAGGSALARLGTTDQLGTGRRGATGLAGTAGGSGSLGGASSHRRLGGAVHRHRPGGLGGGHRLGRRGHRGGARGRRDHRAGRRAAGGGGSGGGGTA